MTKSYSERSSPCRNSQCYINYWRIPVLGELLIQPQLMFKKTSNKSFTSELFWSFLYIIYRQLIQGSFPDNSLLILTTCKCDMLECARFGGFRVYSCFCLAKNRINTLYFPKYQGIYNRRLASCRLQAPPYSLVSVERLRRESLMS